MIRVTFVVVVVLLRVFQAAAQERGYLAIDDQGGRHAFSFRGEADAVNMCGTTACEVVASFASCLGVAYSSPTQGQDVWTWMEAATEADARVGALSECQAAGGPACEVLNVYCIDAPAVEAASELDQSTRRRVQQGLGSAGFDAGMADGLFGPRTRQAIRQWQSSRGAWVSGYLTGAQVEALRGAGGLPPQMPAAAPAAAPAASAELESLFWQSVMNSTNPADFEAYLQQFPNGVFRTLAQNRQAALRGAAGGSSSAPAGSRVGGTRIPTSGSRVSGASVPAPGGAGFSPDQTCAGKPAGAACWMESAQQPGCYVWNPSLATGASVTWTGECVGGLAQGTGTFTWISDGNPQTGTGRLQDGRRTGDWVLRYADRSVQEGPYVDGARNGNWVLRFANGSVQEGPYVDDKQTGNWVLRYADGGVQEGPYVDGARNGNWVLRFASGGVWEGPYVDGKQTGNWVLRFADGGAQEGPYVYGERTGDWVLRDANGSVQEGPYVDGARNGNWVLRFADGGGSEGPYVYGARNGNWVFRLASGGVLDFRYVDGEVVSSTPRR